MEDIQAASHCLTLSQCSPTAGHPHTLFLFLCQNHMCIHVYDGVCVCVRLCARACVCMCVCVCVRFDFLGANSTSTHFIHLCHWSDKDRGT